MLRLLGWLALGVALGFALGGIPARREKAELARENDSLREQLRSGGGGPNLFNMLLGGGPMGELGALPQDESGAFGTGGDAAPAAGAELVEDDDSYEVRDPETGEVTVVRGAERAPSRAPGAGSADDGAGSEAEPRRPRTAEERRARRQQAMRSLTSGRFKQFAAAQTARAAATRATLISSGQLSEQQVAALDTAVDTTNHKLQGYGEEMLTNVAQGKEPEPAEALSLARDVADILHEGQTEVDRIVAETGTEVPPESSQIWNLVDPEGLAETAERVLPETPPDLDAIGPGGLKLPKPPEGFTPPAGFADAGLPQLGKAP